MSTLNSVKFAMGMLFFISVILLVYWLNNTSNAQFSVQLLQKITGNYNQISVYKFPFSLLFRSDNNSKLEYKVARIDDIDDDSEILKITVERQQYSMTIPMEKIVNQEIILFRRKETLSTAWKNIDIKIDSKLSDIFCSGDLIQFKVKDDLSYTNISFSRENPVTLYLLRQSGECSNNNNI